MARNGYKIFDADTHVGPAADILLRYLTSQEQARLTAWEPYKAVNARTRHVTYTRGVRSYRRRLGDAEADTSAASSRYMAGFTGAHKGKDPSPLVDADPAARIQDMDEEGVDVNLTLPSGWFGTWTLSEDPEVEVMMYRAYHRWMDDYCGAFPERLTGVILVSARQVEQGLEEMTRWARQRWPLGVFVYAPYGMPLDHPSLEPVWAAAQDHDLAVVLHTFTVMPPYAPGGLDTWDNLWLQRSAAHPWCGMRNMAALIGSGVMDRYPRLRLGTLEAGHSWLPFWMARLDEHAHSIAAALPPLQHKPSDYVLSGRYFQSIEIPEGCQLTRMVIDLLGEDVLLYASDYPHGESWFPKSVDTVLSWDLPATARRKLFWDNAVKFYARYGRV
jgi:predicted TIM-barrel fold metal-dependent hydrolase